MSKREVLNIHEVHEHAAAAHESRALAPVSLTMAILAVFVAVTSLMGHRAHNQVMLAQLEANFEKSGLAGIRTRLHADDILIETLPLLNSQDTATKADLREKFASEQADFAVEEARIVALHEQLDADGDLAHRKADRFNMAELFCEVALILCSITLLTRQRLYWFGGTLIGIVGLVVAATAFLLR